MLPTRLLPLLFFNDDFRQRIEQSSSESASDSQSGSASQSHSQSQKYSSSASGSQSQSGSASQSTSQSGSDSQSGSASQSSSYSGSQSQSGSASQSTSQSGSDTQSGSASQSTSQSGSDTQSGSASQSTSESQSSSYSQSNSSSYSQSSSYSGSDTQSGSASQSTSESGSDTQSGSASQSTSESGSDTQSGSASQSTSESGSDTQSGSASQSHSQSGSDSQSDSQSGSQSDSDSQSHSQSGSQSGSDSGSDSGSQSQSHSETQSDSQSGLDEEQLPTSEEIIEAEVSYNTILQALVGKYNTDGGSIKVVTNLFTTGYLPENGVLPYLTLKKIGDSPLNNFSCNSQLELNLYIFRVYSRKIEEALYVLNELKKIYNRKNLIVQTRKITSVRWQTYRYTEARPGIYVANILLQIYSERYMVNQFAAGEGDTLIQAVISRLKKNQLLCTKLRDQINFGYGQSATNKFPYLNIFGVNSTVDTEFTQNETMERVRLTFIVKSHTDEECDALNEMVIRTMDNAQLIIANRVFASIDFVSANLDEVGVGMWEGTITYEVLMTKVS